MGVSPIMASFIPLASLASHVVHPTFSQVVHPSFFHLPRSSVRPNFPQVFNLIFSDAGYRPAATFLSVSLHPGFEEWVCFWFSLSWYDKTFINLVATTKPKTSQSHNIDFHQSTESTGTKIYFSRRFSMLSMLSK